MRGVCDSLFRALGRRVVARSLGARSRSQIKLVWGDAIEALALAVKTYTLRSPKRAAWWDGNGRGRDRLASQFREEKAGVEDGHVRWNTSRTAAPGSTHSVQQISGCQSQTDHAHPHIYSHPILPGTPMLLRASPPRQLLPPVLPEDAPYNSLLLASALRVAVDRLHSHLHDAHPPDDMQPNSDSASYDPHSHYQLVTRAQAIARRYSSTSPAASPVQPDAYQLTYPPPPSFPSSDVRYTDPLVPLEVAQPSPVLAPHYAWPPADVPAPYTTPLHRYDTTLQGRSDLYSVPRGMQAHYSPVAPSPIAPYSWPQPPNESFDVGSERPSPASIPAPGAASTSHIYDPTDGAYPIPLSPSGSQDDQLSLANSSPSEPRARRGHAKSSSKTYSFVSLPGSHAKKRPRRRYDEIERLYQCNFILPSKLI